jgi:hypothetical protein
MHDHLLEESKVESAFWRHVVTCALLAVITLIVSCTAYEAHKNHVMTRNGYVYEILPGSRVPQMVKPESK